MSNLSVENVYTRHTAKDLAKKYFWKLLGMMAIVYGITYAISMAGTSLLSLTGDKGIIAVGSFVLMLVSVLVSSGLNLGLHAAMLDLCRDNGPITVGRVFGRMGQCLKACGLNLWVGLKMILWALPAYAVMIAVAVLDIGSVNATTVSESTFATLAILPFIGLIFIFALVVPAALRYMLSAFVLADKPETGVFECVKQSKTMMKGHKWQAFKLIIPIILVMYVIMILIAFAFTFILSAFGNAAAAGILGMVMFVVLLFTMLYFVMRIELSYALFYIKRVNEQNPAQEAAQEPAQAE